jgi:hypothetical protein
MVYLKKDLKDCLSWKKKYANVCDVYGLTAYGYKS